ncbi:hypothetical protein SUGI_1059430 [Cryptomeria japonica]|nr:hypothetical protein SUGI_1059430 [Cryptomeria japonica]
MMSGDDRRALEDKCILDYVGNSVTNDLMELFINEIADEEELALQKSLLAKELCKPFSEVMATPPFCDVASEIVDCLGIANTMGQCSPPDFATDQKKRGGKSISELLTRAGCAVGIRELEGQSASGAFGGLAIIWDLRQVSFNLIRKTPNWMCGRVVSIKSNLNFTLINVYGPTQTHAKKQVWEEIENFLPNEIEQTCLIGGDFNAILDPKEKWGGNNKMTQSCLDFRNWMHKCNLLDLIAKSEAFTWNNRRQGFCNIAEKLDRFFLSGNLS